MKLKFFLVTFFLLLSNTTSSNIVSKEIEGAKTTIIDTFLATKYILSNPKTVKNKIDEALTNIENECCEENFEYKNDINEIKNNLQNCLQEKCQNFILPVYNKDKPPLKVVVLTQINLLDDLFIENEKQKYENLTLKIEQNKNQEIIQKEKNIEKVKQQLAKVENENKKLKITVDKMLLNYQKKINTLKDQNEKLTENFNIVYEAHSKLKQKKLDKQLK